MKRWELYKLSSTVIERLLDEHTRNILAARRDGRRAFVEVIGARVRVLEAELDARESWPRLVIDPDATFSERKEA